MSKIGELIEQHEADNARLRAQLAASQRRIRDLGAELAVEREWRTEQERLRVIWDRMSGAAIRKVAHLWADTDRPGINGMADKILEQNAELAEALEQFIPFMPCRFCGGATRPHTIHKDGCNRVALAPQGTEGGVKRGRSICATSMHDAGAFGRCSYCGRYSDSWDCLARGMFPCDCGKLGGWSGSFVSPNKDAVWSEANYEKAPQAPPHTALPDAHAYQRQHGAEVMGEQPDAVSHRG